MVGLEEALMEWMIWPLEIYKSEKTIEFEIGHEIVGS